MNKKGVNGGRKHLTDAGLNVIKHHTYYHFETYTYSESPSFAGSFPTKTMEHGNLHNNWHFIYFGQSRRLREAYVYA